VYDVDPDQARAHRQEFFRKNRRLGIALCVVFGAIAAVLAAVGFTMSVGRTLFGIAIGLALVLSFRLFRLQAHRGSGPTAWVVPVSAIIGVILLASLPPEWEPLAWGLFSGGLLAMIAGIVRVHRRLGQDRERFREAEREAAEPELEL
jgi:hypothetical protein